MYLKRLEMKGFKSFADKTKIDFNSGISCIVGPNGSGKSNITDAIRWVLGEQKIKSLRGSKMEDIIFNGTKDRKKLGFAEVSLYFDNSERFFPIDFNEVSVTRRIYRSGESEYLINNAICRLKDVKELFLDTGLGTDGYSIIGQGKIDSILSSNKDERRMIFEEASGIVKYKNRKRESERKLENTELNLLRVDDILLELKERIEPLRIESEKAKNYIELSEKLREVEINVFINNYEKFDKKLNVIKKKEVEIKENLESLSKQIVELKNQHLSCKTELERNRIEISKSKDSYYEVLNKIKELEGNEVFLGEKINNFNTNLSRLETEVINLEKRKLNYENDLNSILLEKQKLDSEKQKLQEEYKQILIEYEDKKSFYKDIDTSAESIKSEAIEILNLIEKNKLDIVSNDKIMTSLSENFVELEEKNSEIEKEIYKSENLRKELSEEFIKNTELYKKYDSERNKKAVELDKLNLNLKFLKEKLKAKEREFTKVTTEHSMLLQMEREHEGFDYSVKSAMKFINNREGFYGAVANLFEIPKEYEKAIEVSLGKSLQNIVCENTSLAKDVIEYLKINKKGRATFLPITSLKSFEIYPINSKISNLSGYIGTGLEIVDYDKKFEKVFRFLLGRTLIVKDYETAVYINKNFNINYKIVTLDGEIINSSGSITGGSFKTKISNILSRKRKIKELEEKVELHKLEFKENELLERELVAEIEELNLEILALKERTEKNNIDMINIKNEITNIDSLVEKLKLEYESNKKNIDIYSSEFKILKEKNIKHKSNINNLKMQKKSLDEELLKIKSSSEIIVKEIENYSSMITELKIKLAKYSENEKSLLLDIQRIDNEVKILDESIRNKFIEIKENKVAKEITLEEMEKIKLELIELLSKKDNDNKNAEELEKESKEIKFKLEKLTFEIEKKNKKLEEKNNEIHEIELSDMKFTTEKENIISNLFEKYELSIEEAYKYKSNISITNVNKEMALLKKSIKLIGEVNLSSIEEYKEVKERYEFMYEQHKDLVLAKKSLLDIISNLENTMIDKFKNTIEQIDEHFDIIFKDLFSGGHAKLIIEDLDNILTSNIEIVAQPPGKKLQSLNLLSGGEKALTAIALLFSILKIKPSPFCILDEIEAALDDVNVYRFANFLNHYTDKSQFVVITHRKGTMEVADSLYGVTMEEFGISKIVSVKLSDIED